MLINCQFDAANTKGHHFACNKLESRYYYDSGPLKITRSLENKTPRALKSINNYDYAFQKDVAVYYQTNFMFCYLLKPPPQHFKVEN